VVIPLSLSQLEVPGFAEVLKLSTCWNIGINKYPNYIRRAKEIHLRISWSNRPARRYAL